MKHMPIKKALEFVSAHPDPDTESYIDLPAWELLSRRLFHLANNPDFDVRGSMTRASRAQKVILDRMVGLRRPGTHPAARKSETIEFFDLTQAAIPEAPDAEQG